MELFIIILLQALIFGYFASFLAREKGRDATNWFFLGFLFSFLAIFILIAVPKKQHHRSNNTLSESASFELLKKCPDCAEMVKIDARICRFCRYEFSEESIKIALNSVYKNKSDKIANVDKEFIRCPNCGDEISAFEKFCTSCGLKLN